MAQDKIVADERALNGIADIVKRCIADLSERFESAFQEAERLSADWNDDDYTDFYAAMIAFRTDLDALSENANYIIKTTCDKVEMIHALHNLNI